MKLKLFKRKEVIEAVSQYSLMDNRAYQIPVEAYLKIEQARIDMNKDSVMRDKQESERNYFNYLMSKDELSNDPRFVNMFK